MQDLPRLVCQLHCGRKYMYVDTAGQMWLLLKIAAPVGHAVLVRYLHSKCAT